MKKQVILFILVLLLGVATVYFLQGNDNRPKDDSLFKVERINDVEKIFLANLKGNRITLEKNGDHWLVNGVFRARPEAVEILLETIKRVEVDYPVANSAKENIIKDIATQHTKVEVYDKNDNIVRSYFVGGPIHDHTGTYMFMENGSRPYVCHIRGFNGYLTIRYFTELEEWRDRVIVDYKPKEIKTVKVEYFEDKPKLQSFELTVIDKDSFLVNNIKTGDQIQAVDKDAARQFLTFFKNLGVEGFENDFPKKDSILNTDPFCEITITDRNGDVNTNTFYLMDLTQRSKLRFDDRGRPLKYDLDRLYASVNKAKDFAVIQVFVFGKLLQSYTNFDATIDKAS